MSEVKKWYIGAFGVEAQARPCSPAEFEIIHASEGRLFVLAEKYDSAVQCFLTASEGCVAAERRERVLQQRLTAADERIDELTSPQSEQMACMPVERCYDVRAKMIIAFNEAKKAGGDLDDALDAAYKSALRYSPNPLNAEHPAPVAMASIQEDRETLVGYGRSSGLEEASTLCTRLAYAAYYPPGTRFKTFTPKAQKVLGDLLIKAANEIASLPGGPYERFKAR